MVIKKRVCIDVLLFYPNFSGEFIIHTKARKTDLGVVISQNWKSGSFYLSNFNLWQIHYTTS